MRVVQFEIPRQGRRVGIIVESDVRDITAMRPEWKRVVDVFHDAQATGRRLAEVLREFVARPNVPTISYQQLLDSDSNSGDPYLHPPVDAEDPHRVLITGPGLTHLGSMESRNQMHAAGEESSDEPMTDSKRMFQMGIDGGKPAPGQRGVAPEWFYKGNGTNLRGHRQSLDIPSFARDGGEEAELVGCYVIDHDGQPRRLGFALGNEWSDHATEKMNYLYLAPSKLRQCAVGPELITDFDFQELRLRCTVLRFGKPIYDSGELLSGERHMCHSLANCEDHHFKYPQHRVPGDIHLHFLGTSKLSFGTREWQYEDGDEIRIEADEFGAALINAVRAESRSNQAPVSIKLA